MSNNVPVDSLVRAGARTAFKTFVPYGDLVAMEIWQADQTDSGLLMPDGHADPNICPLGTVIAIGPKCIQVREGDVVLAVVQTGGWKVVHGLPGERSGPVLCVREGQLVGVSTVHGRLAEELADRAKIDAVKERMAAAGFKEPSAVETESHSG